MDSKSFIEFKKATLESDGDEEDLLINTTSEECADQIQVLAFLNGTAMNIRKYGNYLYKQRYRTVPNVSFRSDNNKFKTEQFDGKVVCFTVPSSFLCVRYKGFAFVSGNSEYMTHRAFSRNAASSRAIPVEKMIHNVETNPVIPLHWGANQKGMQAYSELEIDDQINCEEDWLEDK